MQSDSPARILASLLYMQKNHDIVRVNIKLEGVVGENVFVAQAALDTLQLEGWMYREQAVLVEFDGYGRQSGRSSGKALGYPDGTFDLPLVAQGAHVIRAKVAHIYHPGER